MKKLQVALVGCGTIGTSHVANYMSLARDVEVIALCDKDGARAAALADRYGIGRFYGTHAALLDATKVDLVSVCTMPDTHLEICGAALRHGAHVLCEKPPGMHAAEIRALTGVAETAGRMLTFGFNMRYLPPAARLRAFVAGGGLGRLVATRAWAFHSFIPWTGRHQVKSLSGGGALASSAVHVIDLVMWIAGNPVPSSASASMARIFPRKRGGTAPDRELAGLFDVEDTLGGHIRFEDGSWMTLDCAWGQDSTVETAYGFEMIGDAASLHWDTDVRVVAERDGSPRDVTDEVLGLAPADRCVAWTAEGAAAALRAEIMDVVSAIKHGRAALVRPSEAVAVQATVDALYRSAVDRKESAVAFG